MVLDQHHLESKIIVYAWVNDEGTKRSYESKTDAYRVFKKMLNRSRRPPDDWDKLLKQSKSEAACLKKVISDI